MAPKRTDIKEQNLNVILDELPAGNYTIYVYDLEQYGVLALNSTEAAKLHTVLKAGSSFTKGTLFIRTCYTAGFIIVIG